MAYLPDPRGKKETGGSLFEKSESMKAGHQRKKATAIAGLIALTGITAMMLLATLAAGPAAAHPSMNVSFQANCENAAGWVTGPGGSSSEVYLTVISQNSCSSQGSFAVVYVHHTPATLPTTEPSYTPVNYHSGTPRIFVYMSDGSYAFIYPNSVYGAGNVEAVPGGIIPYTTWMASEASNSVAAVYIVADTSQAIPYTAYITCFQYSDVYVIGSSAAGC